MKFCRLWQKRLICASAAWREGVAFVHLTRVAAFKTQPACLTVSGAFHFSSARDMNPHKNARFLNVPAALTGTKRGNVEGCSN